LVVMDEHAYLSAVVDQFRQEAATAANEFELKKLLWRVCVVVCEVSPDSYRDWHLALSKVAIEHGVKPTAVVTTVRSARKRAGVAL